MISFPEFVADRGIKLTPAQDLVSLELVSLINADDNLLRFFTERGSGTTTLIRLIESYYKMGGRI